MTTAEINWTVSREDAEVIRSIVQRAQCEHPGVFDTMTLTMDLTACHLNDCPLKLAELLDADGVNFIHDVAGVSRHINCETGNLGDCFQPRFAV